MSRLFEPLSLRSVVLRNRIGMSPMCMYACDERDGVPTSWHVLHLGARAAGGCGLVIAEASSVDPRGRISLEDTGLWNDEQRDAWRPVTQQIRELGGAPIIQLAHAGRKAGTRRPWEGRGPYREDEFHALELGARELWPVGASAIPFAEGYRTPSALDEEGLDGLRKSFVSATRRAVEAGFVGVELHMAHGYLLHSFNSPLCNLREDTYGGDFEGRTRFPLEIVELVRAELPDELPLLVRISATDWADGGWDLDQSVAFARELKKRGVDLVDVSSGGAVAHGKTTALAKALNPGYQVPFAARIREEAQIPTAAVGLITDARHAESIVVEAKADLVLLGRELLHSPHWAHKAAQVLGAQASWPRHYAWAVG